MQLPPEQVIRAVIQRYARLITRLEAELGTRPMVLPTQEFFPDKFQRDEGSLNRLVARMQAHAGIEDIPLSARIVAGGPEPSAGGCSSGACAPTTAAGTVERLIDTGDTWILQMPEAELRHPVVLTTNLARSLAFVFLVETRNEDENIEPPMDVTADLTAVALGFGALLMQGSYIYAKSCGGPSIAKVTEMSCSELAVAFSLFIARGKHSVRRALRELDATQQALLGEASDQIDSNRSLVELLQHHPDRLCTGEFDLSPPKSLLQRVFTRKKSRPSSPPPSLEAFEQSADLEELEALLIDMPPASRARRPSRPPNPERAKLRQLVDDAFESARAE